MIFVLYLSYLKLSILKGFLILDHITAENGKLYKQRTTVSVWKMLPILIRNHFLHLLICPYLTVKIYDYFEQSPKSPADETIANVLISCFLCGLAFEEKWKKFKLIISF